MTEQSEFKKNLAARATIRVVKVLDHDSFQPKVGIQYNPEAIIDALAAGLLDVESPEVRLVQAANEIYTK